jgi:hypothetical protein
MLLKIKGFIANLLQWAGNSITLSQVWHYGTKQDPREIPRMLFRGPYAIY